MREYINRLSRGKFRYDIPDIIQPDDVIIEDVICDTIHNAEFHIQAQDVIKGVVYSDNAKVTVLTPSFAGKDSDIKYVIDVRGLSEGDSIEGEFTLVTNAGEKEVLYSFTAVKETVDTSLGKADNLFHFTNLVQVNKEEAVSLYRSDKFKKIFLQGDDVLNNLYDVLYDRENVYESMEEFLIAIKKKSALTFSVDNNIRDYNIDGANEKDSIIIEKNGWGYIKLDVQCEAPFIKIKRGIITSDDFIGDVYELDYIIDDKLLHAGNNYAYIIISSYSHQEVIEITINGKEIVNDSGFDEHREIRTAKSRLTAEYLQFRMKRITKQEWVINTNKILDRVRGLKKSDIIFDVLQAGVNFISGDDYNGSRILENIKDRVLSDVDNHIELYSLYLYVSTLERKDAGYTSDVAQIVTECYEHGYDSWVLLWILFYIDGQSENNKSIKLIRIKDCFNDGCISPVMYLEALNIYNAQPELLRLFNRFEIQVIAFGIKYNMITEKLAKQAAAVIANERITNKDNIEILKKLYTIYEEDDILEVLISHMVREGIAGEEAFPFYEKAVLRGIRITRLYEFYMASIKKDIKVRIPRIVLLYFTYDSGINYEWKSFLYANVVYNKAFYKDIYDSYEQMIELYLYEQLKAGCINNDLMYLYRQFLKPQLINNETAEYAVKLRFMYRVTADCSKVKAVIVKCGYMKEPAIYEMTGNDIYIPLYISNCSMAFICTDGVIRRNTVNYEIEKILEEPLDITLLDEYDIEEPYIALFRADYCRKKHIYNADTPSIYKKAAMVKGVTYEYRQLINSWLIEYYKEYYEGETFNDEYSDLIKDGLDINTAQGLIEILLEYGMYYEARELMERYGYTIVPAGKMFKFIVHELTASVNKESYKDILCEYVFRNHLYNELVLEYMVDNYNGSDKDMYRLWKSASDFGVNIKNLSERVISQYMFTQDKDYYDKLTQVFTDYYNKGASQLIAKAYIAYNSFLYFIKGKNVSDITFTVVKECYKDKIGIPVICLAAWLKKVSENIKELNKPDIKDVAQNILDELCAKEIIYDYYKRFNGVLNIPYNACGVTVIEYYGNPDNKVVINYKVNDAKEYASAVMKCDNCGVFTYRLSLFYNDKVIYNYTIGTDTNTKEYNILYDNLNDGDNKGRFDAINECLASEELRDMVTLKKLMESYAVEDYVTKQLFVPENMRQ